MENIQKIKIRLENIWIDLIRSIYAPYRLDPALQNQVALLGDGTPDFGDPEGWYEAAWRVFQNKEENKAFIETNRGVTCSHVPTPPATKFGGVCKGNSPSS